MSKETKFTPFFQYVDNLPLETERAFKRAFAKKFTRMMMTRMRQATDDSEYMPSSRVFVFIEDRLGLTLQQCLSERAWDQINKAKVTA